MDRKHSLYDILGISQQADSADINRAVVQKLDALESSGSAMDPAAKSARKQMIRFAANTLLDPATRLSYDAKIAQSNPTSAARPPSAPTHFPLDAAALALVPVPDMSQTKEAVKLRADAISLRAEALALRADALLLQAGAGGSVIGNNESERNSAWMNFMTSGPLLRVLTFLIVMCAVAFGLSRYMVNAPLQRDAAANQAAEKAALQEYFQTHGIRPASMAELESLEAERRRKENEQRNAKQDVDKVKTDEATFEEESRKRAQVAADKLRFDEEQYMQRMERERLDQERLQNQSKESQRMAEEERIRKLEEQWKQTMKR